jgi:L-ascorbate metabolism protein UlaG (beta-lactamase superfamily)
VGEHAAPAVDVAHRLRLSSSVRTLIERHTAPVARPLSLTWFGCTTFRVEVAGRTLFFDTYVDRPPGLPSVGLSAADVDRADVVFISHAHFDHMLGADAIALATGATVVGSHETAHVLVDNGVPDAQILRVAGGEPVDCGGGVVVRVLPSLHSCLFGSGSSPDSATECLGDLGISAQDRRAQTAAIFELLPTLSPELAAWFADTAPHCSHHDGGQLAYLLETPEGAIFVSASAGYWSPLLRDLRPDVALLALAGRPNVDGEPFQGSLAQYLVAEVELLKPGTVVLCHHDALLPPLLPAVDTEHALARLADDAGHARHVELAYGDPVEILRPARRS